MGFTRAWGALGGAVLTGALVLASAPVASADAARTAEWPLTAYQAQQKVWPHGTGKGVVVAVIDSGVRATHVDLTGQVLPGTDFVHGGNGQRDTSDDGHGTAIASIIAGHGHGPGDADGIKGLAPGAKILPVGVDPGKGDTDTVLSQAIHYAVDHGASVINMSLGGPGVPSTLIERAVGYAEAHNVVVVACSGNTGTAEDDYPASFPGVVSVGGVDQNGNLWSGSTSSSHLTVTAPATGIVSDSNGSDTQMYKADGTSYSAAYVSAIAALIRSAYPHLTQGQVVNLIIKAADHGPLNGAAHDAHWGYGLARPDFSQWATLAENPGPAAGPLPQVADSGATSASGGSAAASSQPATGPASTPTKSGSSGSTVLAVIGGLALLVVIVVVVLIVRRKRTPRGPGGPGGPGAPGTGYGTQQPPPYQQQPYQPQQQQAYQPPYQPQQQNPYGQPPQPSVYQQNPYNQPPPQQQPQQPPYYDGGGAPRG